MQTHLKNKNDQQPDFIDLYQRYSALDNGLKAALRRVTKPEDLRETSAIYRLFRETRPCDQWLRVVFLLPWCDRCKEGLENKAKSFGALLAEAKVNENRLFQMARANEPLDLIFLRRLAMQIKPTLDLRKFGKTLYYWNHDNKRSIVEDFFYSRSSKQIRKGD